MSFSPLYAISNLAHRFKKLFENGAVAQGIDIALYKQILCSGR